jgi:hypothetical protein
MQWMRTKEDAVDHPTPTPATVTAERDEMPDPDNLRIDRTSLPFIGPPTARPVPRFTEERRGRHRADYSRTA